MRKNYHFFPRQTHPSEWPQTNETEAADQLIAEFLHEN